DHRFAAGAQFAAHDLAVAVLALPLVDIVLHALGYRACRHITSWASCPYLPVSCSLIGCGEHFLERCHPDPDFHEARRAQVAHTVDPGLVGNVHGGTLSQDDALDRLGNGHHLVKTDTSSIPIVAI